MLLFLLHKQLDLISMAKIQYFYLMTKLLRGIILQTYMRFLGGIDRFGWVWRFAGASLFPERMEASLFPEITGASLFPEIIHEWAEWGRWAEWEGWVGRDYYIFLTITLA